MNFVKTYCRSYFTRQPNSSNYSLQPRALHIDFDSDWAEEHLYFDSITSDETAKRGKQTTELLALLMHVHHTDFAILCFGGEPSQTLTLEDGSLFIDVV